MGTSEGESTPGAPIVLPQPRCLAAPPAAETGWFATASGALASTSLASCSTVIALVSPEQAAALAEVAALDARAAEAKAKANVLIWRDRKEADMAQREAVALQLKEEGLRHWEFQAKQMGVQLPVSSAPAPVVDAPLVGILVPVAAEPGASLVA